MVTLSNIYNVANRIKGVSKDGYCRPTITELFTTEDYGFGWCTSQPVQDNQGEMLYDNNDELILIQN